MWNAPTRRRFATLDGMAREELVAARAEIDRRLAETEAEKAPQAG